MLGRQFSHLVPGVISCRNRCQEEIGLSRGRFMDQKGSPTERIPSKEQALCGGLVDINGKLNEEPHKDIQNIRLA
jgi:hypothetical protein